jgi:uncharacterized protein
VILPDVNILIYAFRQDSDHHAVCRPWLEERIASDARFGMSPLTLSALVRIATNANFTPGPSTLAEAFTFCDYILGQPNCEVVTPGERHWDVFRRLCLDTGTRGRRVTDAWFAALAIEWGCEWVTMDRDYARFPGLSWALPGDR